MGHDHDGAMIVALLRLPYQAALDRVHARLRTEFPDLHAAHLIVFQVIDHPPAGSRLTALAERARTTKQAMGQLVDALERGGYVARVPDPAARRPAPDPPARGARRRHHGRSRNTPTTPMGETARLEERATMFGIRAAGRGSTTVGASGSQESRTPVTGGWVAPGGPGPPG